MKQIQAYRQDNLCLLSGDFERTVLYLIVNAGSNDDPPAQAGTAHLAEHLNLTCRKAGQLPLCYNASGLTSFDHTTLKFTLRPDENWRAQLGAILDSVVGNPQVSRTDFDERLEEITREYEQNRADAAYQTAKFSFISQNLVRTVPLGSASSLANIKQTGTEDFLRGFYSRGHIAMGILSGAPIAELLKIASPVRGATQPRADRLFPRYRETTGDLLVLPTEGRKLPRIECYFWNPAPVCRAADRMVQILAELAIEGHIKNHMNPRHQYQLCNIVVSELHLSARMNYLYVKLDYLGGALGAEEAERMVRELRELKISQEAFREAVQYLEREIHPPACGDVDYLLYNITQHYLYREPPHLDEADDQAIKNALPEITKAQVDRYLEPKLNGNAKVVLSLPA